ncbi:hypothetical protein C8J27_11333 [Rhodobacter aestuarii]|uniref:Uncharacterized protein n=1 Tax=Rhodobacter aestuarii TaxID=453582 RepID=A0A1N7QBD7_9RHOB|nr:hypothetical protein [Rhodobacter aestuarii]PTV93668.1 hypothetical protein C8J27_11333 [Rhodobacter aestuarii]SIT20208.1 hypothetical protein SAMN05421580_11532 [Rhodobacter aestuarii]
MFVHYSDVILTAADLAAFTSRFPDLKIKTDAPLKVHVLGRDDVEFGEHADVLSQEAKDALTQVVLSFVEARRIPDWLKEAQRAFSNAVLSVLKAQDSVLLWHNLNGISLHDEDFDATVARVEGSIGQVRKIDLSVFSAPYSDQDLEGVIEINPDWFEVAIRSFGSGGSKIAKLRVDLETLFRDPQDRWSGEIRNFELGSEKKNFYRLCVYRLEGASNFLKSLVDDLNAPSVVTGDIARNMLVRSLAGTEPQAALDMLGALGLKTLTAPPFQDRNRVDRLCYASGITGGQLEEVRLEMKEASIRKPDLFAKLGSLGRKQARRDKEITASWPSSEYSRLCQAIGLRWP